MTAKELRVHVRAECRTTELFLRYAELLEARVDELERRLEVAA